MCSGVVGFAGFVRWGASRLWRVSASGSRSSARRRCSCLDAGEIDGWDALWLSVCPPVGLEGVVRAKAWAPDVRAECLRLHSDDGLSCPEVARTVGVPMATVKSWLWPLGHERERRGTFSRVLDALREDAEVLREQAPQPPAPATSSTRSAGATAAMETGRVRCGARSEDVSGPGLQTGFPARRARTHRP
jgi:hypothetical protein